MEKRHHVRSEQVPIPSDSIHLEGMLAVPDDALGIVVFAHGSGSGRFSPRNNYVAEALQRAGIGTLLFDLLTEEEAQDRENVFDVDFLAHRLADAARYLRRRDDTRKYNLAYFGASTGAAAALIAAAHDQSIRAVVSRGGRPDLAMHCLEQVRAPTLLIVGGDDTQVIALNRRAFEHLRCEKEMSIVPGATHLFEEPGTLEQVVKLARQWFERHLKRREEDDDAAWFESGIVFADRAEAGRELAERLLKHKAANPVVLALPRGGVPVAYEVARALEAPLDVIVVRKLGAPAHAELGVGAVVDGDHPEGIFNEDIIAELGVSKEYLDREIQAQLKEVRRRESLYRGGRPRTELKGRTVIVVDDGIATGGSIRAALRGVRRAGPARVVLAVPVAPSATIQQLRHEADEVVCLSSPASFYAIGQFYHDFHQLDDQEVIRLLDTARAARQVSSKETVAKKARA